MSQNSQTVVAKKDELWGHPKGLFVLFFTETWERFSYYGMRALLVLYMMQHLFAKIESGEPVYGYNTLKSMIEAVYGQLANQAMASQIYGIYTSLVYLTPVFGGIIADKFIGQKKSVYCGGILMAIGHLLMASEPFFLLALFFLILGNGFFKPNISTQVGSLYAEGDDRRDRAFLIFYMGVNLGAFFSPFICGTLGQKVGWHWGFSAAGVGMLIGLLVYHFGQKHLGHSPHEKFEEETKAEKQNAPFTADDYKRIVALVLVCAVTIAFWGVYEQQGNTLQVLADQKADWDVFGWTMPSTWLQSFNPFLIFVLTPIMSKIWGWQSKRHKEPGSIMKMAMGCAIMGLGFFLLMLILHLLPAGAKTHWIWLFVCTFFFTVGEIYLSPIGLSFVTKVSPARIVSTMMGIWLLSSFFGNYLAGSLGMLYEKMGEQSFMGLMGVLSFVGAVILFGMSKALHKTVRGV
jgi:POT family proton-dependent oligopeptide transporter